MKEKLKIIIPLMIILIVYYLISPYTIGSKWSGLVSGIWVEYPHDNIVIIIDCLTLLLALSSPVYFIIKVGSTKKLKKIKKNLIKEIILFVIVLPAGLALLSQAISLYDHNHYPGIEHNPHSFHEHDSRCPGLEGC